jgi:hypothetical protein
MAVPNVKQIRRPQYVFSDDGESTHVDKLRGLMRYAPLKPSLIVEPNYLFVFAEEDKDYANKLYTTLKKGIGSFPGSEQFVGLPISTSKLEAMRLPNSVYRMGHEKQLFDAICDQVGKLSRVPDFAYIIGDNRWKYQRPTPYGAIKAGLLKNNIQSQMVTKQLMDADSQFRYAIPNVALSVLAKLGGVPWLVKRSQEPPALVIGVGTTVITDSHGRGKQRLLGYAICMMSNGLFLDLDFYGSATSQQEFLPNLVSGLTATLDRLQQTSSKISRVSLHVSHFERRETISAISAVLDSRKTKHPTPFEVLRLTHDSPFMVMDLSDTGYVAEEGTVVQLSRQHALLVMEGRIEKAPWKGRKPVTLEVHREYASNPSMPLDDSLHDLFYLGFVNWRGFGTKTKPATLAYAKLLSDRMADITAVAPEVADSLQSHGSSGSRLWFL